MVPYKPQNGGFPSLLRDPLGEKGGSIYPEKPRGTIFCKRVPPSQSQNSLVISIQATKNSRYLVLKSQNMDSLEIIYGSKAYSPPVHRVPWSTLKTST